MIRQRIATCEAPARSATYIIMHVRYTICSHGRTLMERRVRILLAKEMVLGLEIVASLFIQIADYLFCMTNVAGLYTAGGCVRTWQK